MRITTKNITSNLDIISNSTYLRAKSFLLFDIETTGFSRENEIIYMIGCIFKTDDGYKYQNIFAEDPSQEPDIIEYFFQILKNIDCIIHFNGNRFDIPFLLARANKHRLKDQISSIESIDIYELLRPLRTSLRFPNLKLDTIQEQLGYKRKDQCSGGDLIQIYHTYTRKPYEPYYDLLLLHNEEDVEGMINLLPLIDVLDTIDNIISNEAVEYADTKEDKEQIKILYKLPNKVLIDFKLFSKNNSQLTLNKNSNKVELSLPTMGDTKRFFFENHKDYMVIIETNEVMHKTVANFIARDKKRKAKKAECYVSHVGTFIPIFLLGFTSGHSLRLFKDDLRSKDHYVIVSTELDQDFYKNQIKGFLKDAKGLT